jgi:hypothetical protein
MGLLAVFPFTGYNPSRENNEKPHEWGCGGSQAERKGC